MRLMKKMIAGMALTAVAMTHTLAVAAEPVAALERTGSPVSESEEMAGGAGIWAVIAAVVIGVGAIILIEEEEDDIPESP
jgi:cell division protein FtsX